MKTQLLIGGWAVSTDDDGALHVTTREKTQVATASATVGIEDDGRIRIVLKRPEKESR